jgi:hypothetical protein
MKWKEHAHLFSNGKFSITTGTSPSKIIGIFNTCPTTDWGNVQISDCTLIARKIEDMTNEEIKGFPHFNHVLDITWATQQIITRAKGDELNVKAFLYLLSIGVYPFDQNHFEKGEVIDIKTLR